VMDEIIKYFPGLTEYQREQFSMLKSLYDLWNSRINVISRKDMDNFYVHHVLHSLAIAKYITFSGDTSILDVGTGGGFPGIPLAIYFPDAGFTLLDSIEKKLKVVNEIKKELKLQNINVVRNRIEDHTVKYDFIVSRAVTSFPVFVRLTSKNVKKEWINGIKSGLICLKGGEISGELVKFKDKVSVTDISGYFSEPYFESKRIIYLPL
jgi:16S rRNA (guanine527-N7)-methyltransferase